MYVLMIAYYGAGLGVGICQFFGSSFLVSPHVDIVLIMKNDWGKESQGWWKNNLCANLRIMASVCHWILHQN